MADAVLHRCRTPTNWLCPCGRVARELKRRGIEADVERVAFSKRARPQIEDLTGQNRVPVLVIDGQAICDSKRIVEHLRWRDGQADELPATAASAD